MNDGMLLRLSRNPHYKLSDEQKRRLAEINKKPMVEFGVPPIHNKAINMHDTTLSKKARKEKDVEEDQE